MHISKRIKPRFYNLVITGALSSCLLGATAAQAAVGGFPDAVVKQPNAEYVETTTDLSVKVLGGSIDLNRTWSNGRWTVNPNWTTLRFIADPLGNGVQSIERSGAIYKRSNSASTYQYEKYSLVKTNDGWRWSDPSGNWINYDSQGRILKSGDRNNISVHFIRDSEGRLTQINDHHGNLAYQFSYDSQEKLINAKDRDNRSVTYHWNGNQLRTVTDVLGFDWSYQYNHDSQLIQRTEPDGGIFKVVYDASVPAAQLAIINWLILKFARI